MNFMRRAVALGQEALGSTSPNPAVGAVVVRNGEIVGEGSTRPAGENHAEIHALEQAGVRANGATLYVTLEPCNHTGLTPPCTDAIIDAGIAAVHAAILDPNPDVAGGGMDRLRSAGIRTRVGSESGAVCRQLEAWLKFVTTGRPFVTAKFAMSIDGKIAARGGDSKWITGDKARWYVHEMRSNVDAVMIGVGTALTDDPRLTARDERGNPIGRQPLRIVADSRGRLPPAARLLSEPGRTLVAVGPNVEHPLSGLSSDCVETRTFPLRDGGVDLDSLMQFLAKERDITSIMVEGGGALLGALFDLGMIDKVTAFVAPTIIGGASAPSPVAGRGAASMAEALELRSVQWKRFGRDTAVIGYC